MKQLLQWTRLRGSPPDGKAGHLRKFLAKLHPWRPLRDENPTEHSLTDLAAKLTWHFEEQTAWSAEGFGKKNGKEG